MATLQAIKYSRGKLLVLDQLRLPHEHHYDEVSTAEEAFNCIRSMRVRGAPAIAIVAALAHAVELHNGACTATTPEEESRPTAVDLSNAINLLKVASRAAKIEGLAHPEAKEAILNAYILKAEEILSQDLENNTSIGAHGAAWLKQQYNASPDHKISVLTHCNTGSLATSGHGTALGIIRSLHSEGLLHHAYCTETRPYNQGSRLTSFELVMAAALFNLYRESQNIGAVIVGADRVVRNGDTANKIGTYSLAVLARHHGVKFVVAAPTTSIDLFTETGKDIEIEQRKKEELTQISGAVVNADGTVDTSKTARVAIADQRINVWNPGFDVTPHELIDAIVTEKGTVIKGADGKFDFSKILPERWEAKIMPTFQQVPRLFLHRYDLISALNDIRLSFLFFSHQKTPSKFKMRSRSSSILLLLSSLLLTPATSTPIIHEDASSYRDTLLSLHESLVRIPSLSNSETDAALFLQTYLTNLNFYVQLQEVDGGPSKRYNVLAYPNTTSPPSHSPKLLITSHIDVVPPYIPYSISSPITSSSLISGRGTVDAKASVAAQITALLTLLPTLPNPQDIMLLYVVGEEVSGDGMRYFSSSTKHKFDSAIFGEPTENKLACGHKGITHGLIKAKGKAGHSGYPQLGKSATEVLIRALNKVLDTDLGTSERYGNTTVNIGLIEGGVAANVIPKDASAKLAIRVASGTQKGGAKEVEERIKKVLSQVDDEALSSEWRSGYGPVECVCELVGSNDDNLGFETMVASYGTDVPNLQGGHKSYLYGPGSILVAHGDDEGLKVSELEEAVEGYKKLIQYVLGEKKEKTEMKDL
ncbi:hypothetical protein QBC38DRAFT_508401 [Podospora fimiseda]|uniref:Methylthioribose-1-phosphate isomerase n=1 Tax=Podospora fimiseda TaxID=252190 RepID=A0AAN7BTL4_9PEZI|nr:hypothetical protein QBC38DRAFT_508401 [Podospora fimiseda]